MTSRASVNGSSTSGYRTALLSSARRDAKLDPCQHICSITVNEYAHRIAVWVMNSSSSVDRPLATALRFARVITVSRSGKGRYLAWVLCVFVSRGGSSSTVIGSTSRVELEAMIGVCSSGAGVAYDEPRPFGRRPLFVSPLRGVESRTDEGVGEGDRELARIFDISALWAICFVLLRLRPSLRS